MAKGVNQKLKLLYLMKIFLEKTDEFHYITMPNIIAELDAYGVSAERKSIYDDIDTLCRYGLDIVGEKIDKNYGYHVVSRQFELAELKLLVDSVQAAKFITTKKSNELIKKIEGLASNHEAKQLQRQVYVQERIKTNNENILYNVDVIHGAIANNVKIIFQYFQWNVKKEMELRHNGAFYCISPWALSWDDENYYLVGYDSDAGMIKHYRVDKMIKINVTDQKREGKEYFKKFDMAVYAKKIFGMFDGEEQHVKLELKNQYAGVIIDRFGTDVIMRKSDEEHFTVNVDVAVSRQFLAWVMALGDGVKILGPEPVVEQMKQEIQSLNQRYNI